MLDKMSEGCEFKSQHCQAAGPLSKALKPQLLSCMNDINVSLLNAVIVIGINIRLEWSDHKYTAKNMVYGLHWAF